MNAHLEVSQSGKSIRYKVLKWIQENPLKTKHTNATMMARAFKLANPEDNSKELSVKQNICNLVSDNVLFKSGNKRKSDYAINYLHSAIPDEMRKNASEEDKKHIQRVLDLVDQGGELDEDGCVVTKEEPRVKKIDVVEKPSINKDESVQVVPVKIKKDKKGLTININLTINY